jgi:hypothetical protein
MARSHLAHLDRLHAGRVQAHLLLDLVRQAAATPFGREHDFRRIRCVADFRRLVPVRQPPEHVDLGPSPLVLAARRKALWTVLALTLAARPHARLFRGRIVAAPPCSRNGPQEETFPEEAALRGTCPLLRPSFLGPAATGPEPLLRLARESACAPVTCLVGEASRLLELSDRLRQLTGRDRLVDVWPDLAAVIFHGDRPAPDRARLVEAVGKAGNSDAVLFLEAWSRPEGIIAVVDPRYGLPRLLPHHGVFFEFLPASEAAGAHPARLGLDEVEPGTVYEMALTSSAGWWACRTGLTICFERRHPLLLRRVEPVPKPKVSIRVDRPRALPALSEPHPRTAGSPAVLAGTPFHSPWSAPVDRG